MPPRLRARPRYHQSPKAASSHPPHGRRGPQRIMDADEIIVHREQRDRVRVILDLLREGIREPGEATGVHPDVPVAPLAIRRADVLGVRVAFDPFLMSACAL